MAVARTHTRDLSKCTRIHQRLNFAKFANPTHEVPRLKDVPSCLNQVSYFKGIISCKSNRLLDKNGLSGRHDLRNDIFMFKRLRADHNRIHAGNRKGGIHRCCNDSLGSPLQRLLRIMRIVIKHRDNRYIRVLPNARHKAAGMNMCHTDKR